MFWRHAGGLAAMVLVCACTAFDGNSAGPADSGAPQSGGEFKLAARSAGSPARKPAGRRGGIARQKDGTLLIAGRSLRCGRNRNVLDRSLGNLGLAAPGVLVFNPIELNRWSDTVRLFVFHHECGHHKVGGSELAADCWAVRQGVRDGWLTRDGLRQVCRSFGGGPATETHPSSARRCASLNRCFATAAAAQARQKAVADAKRPPVPPSAQPKLIQEPILKRSGMRPSPDAR